ncbi:MAG TPA: tRNA epoxyqueuosine(34) reductase QueG [Gaiellales bacterium]|nr:tRNA epoxyqueuosine(34) reductase QueG [Gaiellales bacterium]
MTAPELTEAILAEAARLGIDACGVCKAEPYARAERAIRERAAAGLFADMGFTMRRPERSCDPRTLLRGARSVVAAAHCYARPEPAKPADRPRGRMPRYTRRDEYSLLRTRLRALGDALRSLAPGARSAVYVDANHHVDREAAARSGVAVQGKNTMAITRRHGSWVVLGVLVTDAELAPTQADPDLPAWDACGNCTACIDACPTAAIVGDRVLDARRCLSYLSQSALPELPHAAAFGDRIYGCDICQEVCPWNRGVERRSATAAHDPVDEVFPPLDRWLDSDPGALRERYRRLYVAGDDGRLLQRNARVVRDNLTRSLPPGDRRL